MVDYTLRFDGFKVSLLDGGSVVKSWDAVSGAAGNQSPLRQFVQDLGPIPEGTWSFNMSPYSSNNPHGIQTVTAQNDVVGSGSKLLTAGSLGLIPKFGAWHGGSIAWGLERAFLKPINGTDPRDRTGFSIHGGDVFGSAGCIDLGHNEVDFFRTLSEKGVTGNITLKVAYNPKLYSEPHPLAGKRAGASIGPLSRGLFPIDHLGNPISMLRPSTVEAIGNSFITPLNKNEPAGVDFETRWNGAVNQLARPLWMQQAINLNQPATPRMFPERSVRYQESQRVPWMHPPRQPSGRTIAADLPLWYQSGTQPELSRREPQQPVAWPNPPSTQQFAPWGQNSQPVPYQESQDYLPFTPSWSGTPSEGTVDPAQYTDYGTIDRYISI